jgi:endoribonuclease Dicer
MSYKRQYQAVEQFRDGELNCLVATSIAEEGLDIRDCNMVIRFDLYNTMIQYIQSKGRARKKNSKYFHMIEGGNTEHSMRVLENQQNEERLRKFCLLLPEDRRLTGNDFNMDYFLSKEKQQRAYTIKSTGAKLTYRMSLVILATFVASLRTSEFIAQADFIVKSAGKEYQCEVILPDTSPVKSAIGRRHNSKQAAKCSAAFDMCLKLRKVGALDEYLKPKFTDRLPAMRNARLALSSKKRAEYPMRTKPEIWSNRGIPAELYVTIVKLASPGAMGRSSCPLAILTRTRILEVTRFPIFFGNKNTSILESVSLLKALPVADGDILELTEFTLRIFKDVFSKEYRSEPGKLPYFLAPLTKEHDFEFTSDANPRTLFDWDCLGRLVSSADLDSTDQGADFFKDKFATDPHDGSRKFYTIGHRTDLRPTDPQLPDAPRVGGSAKSRNDSPKDIWNYSISLWAKSRAKMAVRDDLPVIEAEYIPLRRNLLDEYEKADDANNQCYLVFATLKLSAVSLNLSETA